MMKQIVVTLLSFSAALLTSLPSISFAQSNHRLYPSTKNQIVRNNHILPPPRLTPTPIPNIKVDGSPALAWFQGKFYLAYKGASNKNIYYTTCSTDCVNGNNWALPQIENPDGNDATIESPALVVFKKQLYLFHKGADNDNIFYTTISNGGSWTHEKMVTAHSYGSGGKGTATMSGIPALTVFNDKLYLAHKGSGGNAHIYYTSTSDGTNWAEELIENPDGNDTTTESPALATFNQQLYLVHKGADNNNIFYTTSSNGTSWAPEQIFSSLGQMAGMPALTSYFKKYSHSTENDLFIAFRGTDDNSTLTFNEGEIDKNDIVWSISDFIDDHTVNSPAITMKDTDDNPHIDAAYVKKNGDIFFW